jgi:hypothetical protein
MPQGMFQTGPSLDTITAEAQVPEFLKYRQMAARGAQELGDATAPWIKENLGYESPQRKMKAIAANTDLSDGKAVQKTFNALMQMNPRSAQQWLQSVMPVINQHIEQQKMAVTLRGKAKDRRIVVQNGIQYYVDTGERVLPRAPGKAVTPEKPSDLPQMTEKEEIRIGSLVDEAFDFGMTDFTGKKTEVDKETITDFVFSYSQIKNIPPGEVLKGLINGTISLDTPISGQGAAPTPQQSGGGFSATAPMPK